MVEEKTKAAENEQVEPFVSKDPQGVKRMTPMEAKKFWKEPIPMERSGRMYDPGFVESIDTARIDTPTNEEFPDGLWGRFMLVKKGRIEDVSRVISLKGNNMITTKDHDTGMPVMERVENTAVKIRFTHGLLETEHHQCMDVLKLLWKHKDCVENNGTRFDIEQEDPGGLWRFLGLIEEKPTTVLVRKKVG